MQVVTYGEPIKYDELSKTEREILFYPLIDVIKEFYTSEANKKAFEEWLAKKNTNPTKSGIVCDKGGGEVLCGSAHKLATPLATVEHMGAKTTS